MQGFAGQINEVLEVPSNENEIRETVFLMHMNGTDGSTTFREETGRTITATGGVTIERSTSVFGKGSLNIVTNSYLETPFTPSLSLNTIDFTIEFWVYIDTFAGSSRRTFLDTRPVSTNGAYLTIRYDNTGEPLLTINGITVYKTVQKIPLQKWTHITLQRRSDVFNFYINGRKDSDGTNYVVNFNDNRLRIGNGTFVTSLESVQGNIEDLRITKGIALYDKNFAPPTAPYPNPIDNLETILHVQANEISGSLSSENSWNNYPIILEGGAIVSNIESISGNSSLLFNGNDGCQARIKTSAISLFSFSDPYTIEYWFRKTGVFQFVRTMFSYLTPSVGFATDGIRIMTVNDLFVVNLRKNNAGTAFWTDIFPSPSFQPLPDVWYHVALVFNNDQFRLFVNGIELSLIYEDGQTATPVDSIDPSRIPVDITEDVFLGSHNYLESVQDGEFQGYIDDFIITKGVKYVENFQPPNKKQFVNSIRFFPYDGLTHYYRLDETSGTRIDSIGSLDAAEFNGTVNNDDGIIGNAALFNSTSGLGDPGIQTAGGTSIVAGSNTDPFSFSVWAWFNNNSGFYNVFGQSLSSSNRESISLFLPNISTGTPPDQNFTAGTMALLVSSDGTPATRLVLEALNPTPLNQWIHFIGIYDGANLSLYQNGILQESKPIAQIFRNIVDPFAIGGIQNNSRLQGRVDELCFYDRALTSDEIFTLYNLGRGRTIHKQETPVGLITPAVPLENLNHYWKFDEASGTRVDSINSADLTEVNGPISSTTGIISNAVVLNGSNQYLENASVDAGPGNLSVSAWFNPDFVHTGTIFSKDDTIQTNRRGFLIRLINDGSIVYGASPQGLSDPDRGVITTSTSLYNAGTWQHVVMTYNAANGFMELYYNGELVGTNTVPNSIVGPFITGEEFRVGTRQSNTLIDYFDGDIDEIALYHKVLTQREVDILYNQGMGLTT